ncbi:MAG: class I SAM-dependent methyltransferase, partial [Planctomycetes bacterium]|nr:class I SAM-dependent methyltransferase [Planctomycetota bacterium]
DLCGLDDAQVLYPGTGTVGAGTVGSAPPVFRASGDEPLEQPLVRCRGCGLAYVNPRFPVGRVVDAYTAGEDPRFVAQSASRARTFARALRFLSRWGDGRRVLDVGSACGSFVASARDAGWTAEGIEPNHWLRAWAHERYGVRLHDGTLAPGRFVPGAYDWLTFWDVLEHVPSPRATLEEASRLLRSGGHVAINFPDFGSLPARLMGRRWVFVLQVHLYYFTRRTLGALLARTGFRPVVWRRHWQTLPAGYVLERARQALGRVGRFLPPVERIRILRSFPLRYWVGQSLVVAQRLPASSEEP